MSEKEKKPTKAAPKEAKAAKPKAPKKAATKKKVAKASSKKEKSAPKTSAPIGPPRMRTLYDDKVREELKKEFGYTNPMAIPKVTKVSINMGIKDAKTNIKLMDEAMATLSSLSGQKSVMRRARKAISNFKLREGMPIGCSVTMRGRRMYEFLDRLFSLAMPRVRDFRGLNDKSFDGRGNYTMGVKDQLIFPEVDYNKVTVTMGMNITIVTTANTDAEAKALLKHLGMPFRRAR